MDRFTALEPRGGVRAGVEMARNGRAKVVFVAIISAPDDLSKAAA